MAFLISSPLSSPSNYIFETAFFGNKFANGVLNSSIFLGLSSGFIAHILEIKTNFFKNQFRLEKKEKKEGCFCSEISSTNEVKSSEDTSLENKNSIFKKYKLDEFAKQFYNIGIKKILFYFIVFIAIGRIVEMIIPKEWIMSLFSSDKAYSIPLATTIGLSLYLNDSSALPLLKSFINAGAVLTFLIAGKATGIPVMTGMATFLRKRAMFYYIAFIYFGAILCGYLYQIITLLFTK